MYRSVERSAPLPLKCINDAAAHAVQTIKPPKAQSSCGNRRSALKNQLSTFGPKARIQTRSAQWKTRAACGRGLGVRPTKAAPLIQFLPDMLKGL